MTRLTYLTATGRVPLTQCADCGHHHREYDGTRPARCPVCARRRREHREANVLGAVAGVGVLAVLWTYWQLLAWAVGWRLAG